MEAELVTNSYRIQLGDLNIGLLFEMVVLRFVLLLAVVAALVLSAFV
jgi:hypothetical protein